MNKEFLYETSFLHGKPLIFWAVQWFKMSNDAFYKMYGFNFNPHEYSGLYEIARRKVYPEIAEKKPLFL